MKKLLQKLGCFILILLLIKIAFVIFYGDTFLYQRPRVADIARQMKVREDGLPVEGIDTIFIGSSRTALGISPTYFDSLTHSKTKSYNLGIIGATPSYTLDWCLKLIQTRPSLKYVFFELGGEINEPVDYDNWLLTFFKPVVSHQPNKQVGMDVRFQLQNIPLEDFLNKKNNPPSGNTSFEQLQSSRALNLKVEQEESSTPVSSAPASADLWNKISEIAKQSDSKEIRIFFFVPPRLSKNELKAVSSIYRRLESRYKFKVAHYDESLYQIDVSLDLIHLNYKGAKRFTELMAQSFNDYNF